MSKRLGIISLFVILFIAFIWIWNLSYKAGQEEAYVPIVNDNPVQMMPSESGVFKRSEFALDYAEMPVDETHQRSLKDYYKNRAFHGAPPSIPHPVQDDKHLGGNSCLKCHENGGYVDKFKAYTPVVPHPEMTNCRQCHVPQHTQTLFKGSNLAEVRAPKVGVNNALVSSPPVIPHQIQMHENCLSCHAGPSAPKEIRVTHPERTNCRQCHVLNNKEMADRGTFKRATTNEE
ncbi:nitrate reductase cytochrome c-type subunit [Seonamhaeicola marinus]|uniref:Cytochrome C n=1 Tax=Seonamhaeicola marinus TaxID=1912246 RepID=A0A5D0I7X0_9FLAO|nr:nitrate reductase cytochrome c-type subunit [Seonamhaeicola marinus]TYA78507.1 cytochrome C [Seonamhaeicola marinus]